MQVREPVTRRSSKVVKTGRCDSVQILRVEVGYGSSELHSFLKIKINIPFVMQMLRPNSDKCTLRMKWLSTGNLWKLRLISKGTL